MNADTFGGLPDEIVHQRFLGLFAAADIDADHRHIGIVAVKTGNQAGVGSRASTGANDTVDFETEREQLA